MKKIIIFFAFFCAMLTLRVSAQVTIPDANFRAKLKLVVPTCFGANDVLDTICAANANIDSLDVRNAQIVSIEGVWYFKKLNLLVCSNNLLTSIPSKLPLNLKRFVCSNNQITNMPPLPNTVYQLWCDYNLLTSLPPLPTAMMQISNPNLWYNMLKISHNQLTSLPTIPSVISDFDCSFNQLTSISTLPINLRSLDCSNNQLTSLPALPINLDILDCSNNLTLACLPTLPDDMYSINISSTGITCLPNRPYYLFSNPLPNCGAGINPNGCAFLPASVPFYITIPDVKLRAALKSQFPSCFNASDQLDTSCAAIAPAYNMYLSSKQISNLQGIQYFKKIQYLDCSVNQITNSGFVLPKGLTSLDCASNQLSSLGTLPTGLTLLNCGSNQFTSLGTLPNNLTSLTCNNNQLTSLATLPTSLKNLNCSVNPLGNLGALPAGLTSLTCNTNQLSNLGSLPTGLTSLACNSNQLSSLGTLPTGLQKLECMNNQLSSLGTLPAGLTSLYSSNNSLSSFPSVLPIGLKELKCAANGISVLPNLPATLGVLECNNNQITAIPELPTALYRLYCQNNATLSCLPVLSQYLYEFNISGTAIGCLPNKPSGITNNTTPLCNNTNNPNQCIVLARMSGYVFNDLNNNGVKDANETPRVNVAVQIPSKNYAAFTNNQGFYEIAFNELGTYAAAIQLPLYYSTAQATPSATFTAAGQQITQNFPVTAQANVKDFRVALPHGNVARPGFSTRLYLRYENVGTIAGNATIKFKKPTAYTVTASSANYTVVDNDLVFNLGNRPAGFSSYIFIDGVVNATTPLGTILKFTSAINEGDANEVTPLNNVDTLSLRVVGSYDPNDKQGPASITPTQLAGGRYLDYTIRFQNTGTYYAQNVAVIDTLIGLQANTLELVASSHNVKATVRNNIARFEYLNIYLPDSNTNEAESHGFVKFRIKPTTNLLLGDVIKNKAAIYFDFNAPIITNTVNTVVAIPTSIAEKVSRRLEVYPNPLEGEVLTVPNMRGASAKLLSLEGKELRTWSNIGEQISLQNIASGMYLLEVLHEGQRRVAKVVVK